MVSYTRPDYPDIQDMTTNWLDALPEKEGYYWVQCHETEPDLLEVVRVAQNPKTASWYALFCGDCHKHELDAAFKAETKGWKYCPMVKPKTLSIEPES